ncbi:MAG: hypothetical protein Q4D38_09100 [Planctomycetia bacterium]|nr:hypothetical protein [Planctomycetia bacterium]
MRYFSLFFIATFFIVISFAMMLSFENRADSAEGKRPYELDWAGRVEDEVPPLVDFETTEGWRVETQGAIASFERSNEQKIWGDFVGKLVYRRDPEAQGRVRVYVRPPQPVPVEGEYDAFSCWIFGNNWAWESDETTPRVSIDALFLFQNGEEIALPLAFVNWKEWFLCYKTLSDDQEKRLHENRAAFNGFCVHNGNNLEDRTLFFDNFSVRKEEWKPLEFAQRAKRGVIFSRQNPGLNTGEGNLPFPTRELTIAPDSSAPNSTNSIEQLANQPTDLPAFRLTYVGSDGRLEYLFAPGSGCFGDIQARWNDGAFFTPCAGGGVRELVDPKGKILPVRRNQHLRTKIEGEKIVSTWKIFAGEEDEICVEAEFTLRICGKSLLIESYVPGGRVANLTYGALPTRSLNKIKAIPIPYYAYQAYGNVARRPALVSFEDAGGVPLFLMGNSDWYATNGSELYSSFEVSEARGEVIYNGGARYNPCMDGTRNDCFERFFVTISPEFHEVLPNIPNPPSPWKHVTGRKQWNSHGAGVRDHDKAFWFDVKRNGMTEVLVTDHEVCWRDGGESFTFRTKAAPGKGGDEGMFDYARYMQDELGFFYGPYNNFTDFAPVNEYWDTDMVSRSSNGALQTAWARCYAPKPARAVEFCEKLTPINQEKFHFSTAYCDVHTSVTPWSRVDYDVRVPGAGTSAAVFYAYGELLLLQRKYWGGPVYSEGPHHCFYSGLTDGNYAQDGGYKIPWNPWLVDFDLLKMHPLECNFGMGNPDMFFGRLPKGTKLTPADVEARADRFFAATVAFGHPGFLAKPYGKQIMRRGYFMLQQLHERYTQGEAVEILYCDAQGVLWKTSDALRNDAYKRSQVVVKYSNGVVICANGSATEPMRTKVDGRLVDLPPQGYSGWTLDGEVFVLSAQEMGKRFDYCESPKHIFIDGRGNFQKFHKANGAGAGVCRMLDDGDYEIILFDDSDIGFKIEAESAVALNYAGDEIGPAKLRLSRGYTHVEKVPGAFSYRIKRMKDYAEDPHVGASAFRVLPGQTVEIHGADRQKYQIPLNAPISTRHWFQVDGRWVDFWVTTIANVEVESVSNELVLRVEANLGSRAPIFAEYRGEKNIVTNGSVRFALESPTCEGIELCEVVLSQDVGDGETHTQTFRTTLATINEFRSVPFEWEKGEAYLLTRDGSKRKDWDACGGGVFWDANMMCGGVLKAGFSVHPPYKGAVGAAILEYDIALDSKIPLAFHACVGKRDGSDLGDGIWYQILVVDSSGKETLVAEESVATFGWKPISADLSAWRGQKITLRLVADCGPANNTSADWGAWGEMRLESVGRIPTRHVWYGRDAACNVADSDETKALSLEEMRSARRGWLAYRGKGLAGNVGEHVSFAFLNENPLGMLALAAGDEVAGVFSNEVLVELTPEAIRSLDYFNWVRIENPHADHFSIGDVRIVLELSDGSHASSLVGTARYTQPGTWRYAEGIRFPTDEMMRIPVRMKKAAE